MSRRCVLPALLAVLTMSSVVQGFTTTSVAFRMTPAAAEKPTATRRNMMIAPDQLSDFLSDHHTAAAIINAVSSTQLLAADGDGSWWDAYINIFEAALKLVHSGIDGPLRSLGVEQTWGVSIFVFTACTYCCFLYVYPKGPTAPLRLMGRL